MNDALDHSTQFEKNFEYRELQKNRVNNNGSNADDISIEALWKPSDRNYKPGVFGLHDEIKDFANYISPTDEEHWVREIVVAKVKNVVYGLWPECHIDVFGSFKTGLYLPTSDIDMVIFGKWDVLPLCTLERAIRATGIASEIKVLSRATVPILKLTDINTGLHVDISFNMMNSVHAAEMIRCYIDKYPCMIYIVYVLKQFILQRDLNEVWTGGISSYALILMIISFLQHGLKQNKASDNVNLGVLLLEFFELYGLKFNYMTTAIRIRDGGSYVRKDVLQNNLNLGSRSSILCIEDPLCPGNDVGRSSYLVLQVQKAFEHAYSALSNAIRLVPTTSVEFNGGSILGRIIRISSATLEIRERLRSHAKQIYGILPHFIVPPPLQVETNSQTTIHPTGISAEHRSLPPNTAKIRTPIKSATDQLLNKPLLLSALGFSTLPPPLLRPSYSSDMLRLSTTIPSSVHPHPMLISRQNTANSDSSVSSTKNETPCYILFPPSIQSALGSSLSLCDAKTDSLDRDSDSTSSEFMSCKSDSNHSTSRDHNSGFEVNQTDKDLQQQSSDRFGKSVVNTSKHNSYVALESQLAPLRIFSSDQNTTPVGTDFKRVPYSVNSNTAPLNENVMSRDPKSIICIYSNKNKSTPISTSDSKFPHRKNRSSMQDRSLDSGVNSEMSEKIIFPKRKTFNSQSGFSLKRRSSQSNEKNPQVKPTQCNRDKTSLSSGFPESGNQGIRSYARFSSRKKRQMY